MAQENSLFRYYYNPYFARKTHPWRKSLLAKPWMFPVAAMHVAATAIQALVRGVLLRERFRSRRVVSARAKKTSTISARYLLARAAANPESAFAMMDDDSARRYWFASRIQACWRMREIRHRYVQFRFAMYHVAAIQIQWAYKAHCQRKYLRMANPQTKHQAAAKLQRVWRSFTDKRIYKYYRDLIHFRERGNPAQMLKSINPLEAQLMEAASNLHLRFRLGGMTFPPAIYYKIFIHGSLVDVNAFAPRDYTKERQKKSVNGSSVANSTKAIPSTKQFQFSPAQDLSSSAKSRTIQVTRGVTVEAGAGWYERFENNGWRPVSEKLLEPVDDIEQMSAKKRYTFHYDRTMRKELKEQERKRKKVEWMKKLYQEGKQKEIRPESNQPASSVDDLPLDQSLLFSDKAANAGSFNDLMYARQQNQLDDDLDFDPDLVSWSQQLDFEQYYSNWATLATSARTEVFVTMNHSRTLDGISFSDVESLKPTHSPSQVTQQSPSPLFSHHTHNTDLHSVTSPYSPSSASGVAAYYGSSMSGFEPDPESTGSLSIRVHQSFSQSPDSIKEPIQ
eukprot:GILJ01006121.1.p1 GENE.GILJ01006121.1~~GILJ01006121.1.p1  ORF type:complete len:563 (+),score=89.50 GILJ01006121.1:144-1832(+)